MSALTELQHLLATPQAATEPSLNGAPAQHGNSNANVGLASNPVAIAHAALQALRDSGDERFLFLRTVLEIDNGAAVGSTNQELFFHCVAGVRHVVLSRWAIWPPAFRRTVRDYLMVLGHSSSYSRTIRMTCYNASASMWKRCWAEEEGTESIRTVVALTGDLQGLVDSMNRQKQVPQIDSKQVLFQYLESMLRPGSSMVTNGACYLSILIGEFAGKSSSNYRMPLEFHKRAHLAFEKDGSLDHSLRLSMNSLSYVVSLIVSSNCDGSGGIWTPELVSSVLQVTIDVLGWEFGSQAWDASATSIVSTGKALLRLPKEWREIVLQPDFCKACFHVHKVLSKSHPSLGFALRQLLLQLSSISGPIFQGIGDQTTYSSYLLEGILEMLSACISGPMTDSSSELLDTLGMTSRLIANFRLSVLVQLPLVSSLPEGLSTIGRRLLQDNVKECEAAKGDLDSMENREWREECLSALIEGVTLLCEDPWLLYSGSEESRNSARMMLASSLGPLYAEFVVCRTRMARMEEHYLTENETELDEVREDIVALDLDEEMASLANVGRLDMSTSISCLYTCFQALVPQLEALWQSSANVISPEAAGLLEESRLVTMFIGHLLTDDSTGETPLIPDAIVIACQNGDAVTKSIGAAVEILVKFAQVQVSQIVESPSNPLLSPILAKAFLWFFNRWAPAYVLPSNYGKDGVEPSSIISAWSDAEAAKQVISFCTTLCLHYLCFWPQERQVQEGVALLLFSLAKRGAETRDYLAASPAFRQIVTFHCLTSGIRHSVPAAELDAIVRAKAGTALPPLNMVRGYQRLPYHIKSQILTALLVACSEEKSATLFNDCLKTLHDAFSSLVHVLSTKKSSANHIDAKEMASLCAELYGGVARASDMHAPERIPAFLTPPLPHLSGLMAFYAEDLSICETLLRLFRDYSERFIASLDPQSSMTLFQSSAELLKSYSEHHCVSRVIIPSAAEEDQNYSDVLCAIQLLIQLGTKDFFDAGGGDDQSKQVTDVIFFGLQQILPLMTRGLLQYPELCAQYFSLVGFMMETYPDKIGTLPYELFNALMESLLFGMSYHDAAVSKSSLHGIAGIIRDHLQTRVLDTHLAKDPALLDKCSKRLLLEVVFQNVVWDRLEPAGMALLPLAAADMGRFGEVVQESIHMVPAEHQRRLAQAFEGLMKPEVVAKVASRGYEGRQYRIRFKKDFENFCNDIHSFLVVR